MDLVVNHTSDQHPWFKESRSSKNNPKRDWYIWHPGKNKKPPNNWISCFGGNGWEYDSLTDEFYYHSFLKEQPDLNWRNDKVKDEIFNIMRFYLNMGIDGFRLDVVNFYFKDLLLRNNPNKRIANILDLLKYFIYPYDMQKHLYDKDQEEMINLLKEMRLLVDEYGDKLLLGEVGSDDNTVSSTKYYGNYNDGLHLSFNFDFLKCNWSATAFKRVIERWEKILPSWAWPTYVLSNHDVVRHISRFGQGSESLDRAKIALTMLLTLRGTPVIYYGEEIGMKEAVLPKNLIKDPPGKRFWPFYKGRDGCRTPMQWDDSENAGFSMTTPWLPVNKDYRDNNVDSQNKNPNSLLNFYRKLIWLRKRHPVLQKGSIEFPINSNPNILCFKRNLNKDSYTIILNFSSKEEKFELVDNSKLTIISAVNSPRTGIINSGLIILKPYEALICKNTQT